VLVVTNHAQALAPGTPTAMLTAERGGKPDMNLEFLPPTTRHTLPARSPAV
jgi:hypothetical protein